MQRSTFAVAIAILAAVGLDLQGAVPVQAATAEQQALAPDLVKQIQRGLNQRGYGVGPVDGVMGRSTRDALQRFQRDNALPGTGQIDRQTLVALGVGGANEQTAGRMPVPPPGQKLAPGMVQDIQRRLQAQGYDPGRVDGVWGGETQRALAEFQRDRNLASTGRIDEKTLAALEGAGPGTQTGQLPAEPREPPRR